MKFVIEITPQDCGWVFSEFGIPSTNVAKLFKSPEEVALVVFTGGSDITPELYGEPAIPETHYNTQRDIYEGEAFEEAQKHKIPCVGICRGAQFLCVKSGGKLIQDISNHNRTHTLETNDGRIITCNSSHHQMQFPNKEAIPLAWAEKKLSNGYKTGYGQVEVDKEYEVVYYPNIKSLGIQYHPEWLNKTHECVKYAQEVVKKYLF